MKKMPISVLAILFVTGCSSGSGECSPASFVKALKPEAQFKVMLAGVVERTQTVAARRASDSNFAQKLQSSVKTVGDRHAENWTKNLVASWSTLSVDDMQKACAALDKRDEALFSTFASKVGADVQARNEPLLKQAATEVLQLTEGS